MKWQTLSHSLVSSIHVSPKKSTSYLFIKISPILCCSSSLYTVFSIRPTKIWNDVFIYLHNGCPPNCSPVLLGQKHVYFGYCFWRRAWKLRTKFHRTLTFFFFRKFTSVCNYTILGVIISIMSVCSMNQKAPWGQEPCLILATWYIAHI